MTAPQASIDERRLPTVTRTGAILYGFLRRLGIVLAKVLWRFEVTGRDRLPTVGPFVLCPVHRSYVDFLIAAMTVPRRMRFMGKDSLWREPRLARFFESLGAFPVNRDHPDRTALRRAEECIANGEPVVMFPEGQRREGELVKDLHRGPAFVASRGRVPVVPVGIGGSDRALPIGAKMIRFAKVRVVIGEPIYPDVPLTGRVSPATIRALTDQIRDSVQELYDEVR